MTFLTPAQSASEETWAWKSHPVYSEFVYQSLQADCRPQIHSAVLSFTSYAFVEPGSPTWLSEVAKYPEFWASEWCLCFGLTYKSDLLTFSDNQSLNSTHDVFNFLFAAFFWRLRLLLHRFTVHLSLLLLRKRNHRRTGHPWQQKHILVQILLRLLLSLLRIHALLHELFELILVHLVK